MIPKENKDSQKNQQGNQTNTSTKNSKHYYKSQFIWLED
jgi:hypothetical protein